MEKKTKFKRRMFAVAAIVGMGMTMTQIAFGKESFNAESNIKNVIHTGHLSAWRWLSVLS